MPPLLLGREVPEQVPRGVCDLSSQTLAFVAVNVVDLVGHFEGRLTPSLDLWPIELLHTRLRPFPRCPSPQRYIRVVCRHRGIGPSWVPPSKSITFAGVRTPSEVRTHAKWPGVGV